MVSVCMATYNGEKYIHEQINSILPQLTADDELIVSDDGSTDNTLAIVALFNDPRIKIFHASFKHPALNFGFAISKATGNYIFLSDQDDVWFPNKVEVCLPLLKQYSVIVSDCVIVDEKMNTVEQSMFSKLKSGSGLLKNLARNRYLGCCMCFHRQMLPVIMPFPRHIPMHDIWIGFVADFFFKTKFLEVPLVYYRRHGKNLTSPGASKATILRRIKYRMDVLRYIPLLMFRNLGNASKSGNN